MDDSSVKYAIFRLPRIHIGGELILQVLLCITWGAMLLHYVLGAINHFTYTDDYGVIVISLFLVTMVVLAFPHINNKLVIGDYIFYLLNAVYYLSNYAFFPENTDFLTESVGRCLFCVFPFYFIGRIFDIEKLFNVLIYISAACIYIDLVYFALYSSSNATGIDTLGEDMFAAYQVVPHIIFMLWTTLEKFKLWKVLTVILGFILQISFGSRGPLVCIGFFGIIYFFFYMKFKGAIYVKSTILLSLFIVLIYLNEILYYLLETFTNLKMSTRIIDKIVSGEMADDSYRSVLRDKLYTVLEQGDHFWGLGIFGCRNYDIIYPHFLPLDMACTFGNVLGYTFTVLLFIIIGLTFWITRGTKRQQFLLYLFSVSIVKLMLSNTFLYEPYFFFLLGFCAKELLSLHAYMKVPKVQQVSEQQVI